MIYDADDGESFFSCDRGGDTPDGRALGESTAGFITSDSLPLDGGVGVRRSTTILSSVGDGTDDGDSVSIGGSAMCPTGRGWGGSWPVTAGVLGYVVWMSAC